MYSIKILF